LSCLIILAILFLTHKRIASTTKNKWWIYSALILNVSIYSYGGTYAANCAYDFSQPTVYKTKVLDKRVYRGKHIRRYVKIAPWGHHYDTEEIRVGKEQYDELNVGDSIAIDLKQGLFNIPWF
jgi:hypothetical protein